MTYIQDIPDDSRERLRREIFDNIEGRREEALQSFWEFAKYMGIILSGGTIGILGFIGTRKDAPIPVFALISLLCFAASILSFAGFLYRNYQIHQARWNYYADTAHEFFTRGKSLEDVLEASHQLRFGTFFKLLFWVPFSLACLGFLMGLLAIFSLIK